MSKEAPVDMLKANELQFKIGTILDGEEAGTAIVALTMALISMSVGQDVSFKRIIKDIIKIEETLKVGK